MGQPLSNSFTIRTHIKPAAEGQAVEFNVIGADADVPGWFKIAPASTRAKIRTSPVHEAFRQEVAFSAVNADLLATARDYLVGELDASQAEARFAETLSEWVRLRQAADVGPSPLTGTGDLDRP